MQEIQKAVRQLKLGRSGGTDMFINEFLYYGNESLLNTLHVMFNNIFKIGYFSFYDCLLRYELKRRNINIVNSTF